MLSLRLNTANRFIGSLLLMSFGILVTLLVLTWRGSAVPEKKAAQMIKIYNTTSIGSSMVIQQATYTVTIQDQGAGSTSQARQVRQSAPILVHLYPYQWQAQPIRLGAEIAAGVTIFLGLLYVGLKFLYRNLSKEVFP
jgi:hypothetical protein